MTQGVRKQQSEGEKGPGLVISTNCMEQDGIELAVPPASAISFAKPPSLENSGVSLVGFTQSACGRNDATDTLAKNGTSRQAQHPENPTLPTSIWQQASRYFEIKRLKKCERKRVDCLGYVLDAFYPNINVNDVL